MRSQDNKDRWLVTIDPATGKAAAIDTVHDDAWIREGSVSLRAWAAGSAAVVSAAAAASRGCPTTSAFLFMAEKDGWMHLYSLDMSQADARPRSR